MRKYTGNTDAPAKGVRPGTTELVRLARRRFRVKNLGTYANRSIRLGSQISVHSTGRAVDLGYSRRKTGLALYNFLIDNTAQLQIEAIHDYAYRWPLQNPADKTAWGAGYRCNRGEGLAGVKIYTATNNAGSPGGKWLHVELSPAMADNAAVFRLAWIDALKASALQ